MALPKVTLEFISLQMPPGVTPNRGRMCHTVVKSHLNFYCLQNLQPYSLEARLSSGGSFVPQGAFGKVWRHFLLSQLGRDSPGIQWVNARDAAKHPIMQDTTKNYSAQMSVVLRNLGLE